MLLLFEPHCVNFAARSLITNPKLIITLFTLASLVSQAFVRPTVGKASLQVVASARQSSFSGYGAFTAAAKQQSSRGVRSAMRRGAVQTKAKVTIEQQSDRDVHARN